MKILWLSWKDRQHPQWGGAEVLTSELRQRLIAEGHQVTLLTSGYPGAPKREMVNGIEVIRVGDSRYSHPFKAIAHFNLSLRNKFDIVIEEVNATPYFSVLTERSAKRFLFYHHLEREVWLHEAPKPLNWIGYHIIEPIGTRLLGRGKVPLITVSKSTAEEMTKYGFRPDLTHVISEGIELEPLKNIDKFTKFKRPTVLSLGGIRAMKRTLDQVRAFELAKKFMPRLQLKIAGNANGPYGQKVLDYIAASPYTGDISYLGSVSRADKLWLLNSSHCLAVTSVKEGWGLTVTEAASQGTPAVVYDVPGLRESVRHNQTGLVTPESPQDLAHGIVNLIKNKALYNTFRRKAWEWSKQINFDQSYKDFKKALQLGGV